MLYDFKELHIITPVGLIQIEGKFSMSVYMQIESAFLCCNGNDDKENIICFLTIEQESERWMTIKSNEGSQKVYYRSVCDFLENSITNLIIRETKESDSCLCFRGNWSYKFYVGDINVDIMDKEIRLSGTKYVLNKILE